MNNNSVFAETKKERQLKELAFLSILYFCVTVAIVTLMTLIYDAGKVNRRYFFTMEFVNGPSLKDYVDERTVLEENEALAIIHATANQTNALAWIHTTKGTELYKAQDVVDSTGTCLLYTSPSPRD